MNDSTPLPPLGDVFRDDLIGRREESLRHWLARGDRATIFRELGFVFQHPDGTVRRRAAEFLKTFGGSAANQLLLQAANDSSWVVREAAVRGLCLRLVEEAGKRQDSERPAGESPLFGTVSTEDSADDASDSHVREEDIVAALVFRLVRERTPLVREAALAGLTNYVSTNSKTGRPEANSHLMASLVASLADHRPPVRVRAALAVARLAASPQRAVAELAPFLQDSHYKVRVAAAKAIGSIPEAAAKVIPTLIQRCFDGEPKVAHAAQTTFQKCATHVRPTWLHHWITRVVEVAHRCSNRGTEAPAEFIELLRDELVADPNGAGITASLATHRNEREAWIQRTIPGRKPNARSRRREAAWEIATFFQLAITQNVDSQ